MPQIWEDVLPLWADLKQSTQQFYTELDNYGLIACMGPDAATFLQGQISADVSQAKDKPIGGVYAQIKGRVIANFWLMAHADGYLLLLPKDLIESTKATLKKYGAFSKVSLEDVSNQYTVYGLINCKNGEWPKHIAKIEFAKPLLHHLLICNKRLEFQEASSINNKAWDWLMMQQGIATINPKISGEYTPHHLNFVNLGFVSFNKGCYLGQEIIARMQYRGKLKQHLYLCELESSAPPTLNMSLHVDEKSIGNVINSLDLTANTYCILALLTDKEVEGKKSIPLNKTSTLNILHCFKNDEEPA